MSAVWNGRTALVVFAVEIDTVDGNKRMVLNLYTGCLFQFSAQFIFPILIHSYVIGRTAREQYFGGVDYAYCLCCHFDLLGPVGRDKYAATSSGPLAFESIAIYDQSVDGPESFDSVCVPLPDLLLLQGPGAENGVVNVPLPVRGRQASPVPTMQVCDNQKARPVVYDAANTLFTYPQVLSNLDLGAAHTPLADNF